MPQWNLATQTRDAVRAFIRGSVASPAVRVRVDDWPQPPRWVKSTDGHFRPAPATNSAGLECPDPAGLPGYTGCVETLRADPVVAPHLDTLVGTRLGATRLDADTLFRTLLWPQIDADRQPAFSEEGFDQGWSEFARLCRTDSFTTTTVVPLPGLVVAEPPLVLSESCRLDLLTEPEVTNCSIAGILRPSSPVFPIIYAEAAVGLRHTATDPKVVGEIATDPAMNDEGAFGRRPIGQLQLIAADVLLALRLLKATLLRTPGVVQWTDSTFLGRTLRSMPLGSGRPFFGSSSISQAEAQALVSIWQSLSNRARRFRFGLDRFSQAFDRLNDIDRLVDFVIAAESILLADNSSDRAELSFRAALRASKLVTTEGYSERDVFRLMRKAYGARSTVVHGAEPPKRIGTKDKSDASVAEFNAVLEELIRDGLRKAVVDQALGDRLRDSAYWDDLLFP